MPINPQYLAARSAEIRNRQLAHVAVPAPLCGVAVRHLTPRHVNELRLEANAFFLGGLIRRADVFQFLWRLHPEFARPCRAPLGRGPELLRNVWSYGWRAGWARRALVLAVARAPVLPAIREIQQYLAAVHQDNPAADETSGGAGGRRPALGPPISWLDNYVLHFLRICPGWTPDEIIDYPFARLLQLHREEILAAPEGELNVIDPSDALLTAAPITHV